MKKEQQNKEHHEQKIKIFWPTNFYPFIFISHSHNHIYSYFSVFPTIYTPSLKMNDDRTYHMYERTTQGRNGAKEQTVTLPTKQYAYIYQTF